MNTASENNSSEKKKMKILSAEEALDERRKMTYEQRFDLLMKLIRLEKIISSSRKNSK